MKLPASLVRVLRFYLSLSLSHNFVHTKSKRGLVQLDQDFLKGKLEPLFECLSIRWRAEPQETRIFGRSNNKTLFLAFCNVRYRKLWHWIWLCAALVVALGESCFHKSWRTGLGAVLLFYSGMPLLYMQTEELSTPLYPWHIQCRHVWWASQVCHILQCQIMGQFQNKALSQQMKLFFLSSYLAWPNLLCAFVFWGLTSNVGFQSILFSFTCVVLW